MDEPISSISETVLAAVPPIREENLIKCYRCGCDGVVQFSEAGEAVVASACRCAVCSGQGCALSNIRSCVWCGGPFELVLDSGGRGSFACQLRCVQTEPPKRFLRLRDRDIDLALPPWNRTLLHSAVIASDVSLAWYLLQRGANPFARDYRGVTPVDIAHLLLASVASEPAATSPVGPSRRTDLTGRIRAIAGMLPDQDRKVAEPFTANAPRGPKLSKCGSDSGTRAAAQPGPAASLPIPPSKSRFISAPVCGAAKPSDLAAASLSTASAEAKAARAADISRGAQPFTPLTLVRLTSGSDVSPAAPETRAAAAAQAPAGADLRQWRRSEMCHLIAEKAEVESRVGTDVAGRKPSADAAVLFSCSACFDTLPIEQMRYSCGRLGCSGCLCVDCLARLVFVTVTSCLYAVPSVRCPGTCQHRIPTAVWRGALRDELAPPDMHAAISKLLSLDSNSYLHYDESMTVEQLLMERYVSNAEALLMLRCSSCDGSAHLFYSERNDHPILKTVEERLSLLDELLAAMHPGDIDSALAFLHLLAGYYNGEKPADAVVAAVVDALCSSRGGSPASPSPNEPLDRDIREWVGRFLCAVVDVERRLCLQLAFFRLYPKIYTPCCEYEHCFMCKVQGHHYGETCEEVQQRETGTEVQYCPACGVPTLRTEGCNDIFCVCGQSWIWQGDDDISDLFG